MEEQMRNDEMEIDLIELFHVLLKKSVGDTLCLVIGAVTVGGIRSCLSHHSIRRHLRFMFLVIR